MSKDFSNSTYYDILLLTGILLGCILLQFFLSFLICLPLGGVQVVLNIGSNPSEHLGLLKALQILQGICLFIVPAYVFAKVKSINFKESLQLQQTISWKTAFIIVLSMVIVIPFINLLGEFNASISLPPFLLPLENKMLEMEENAAIMTQLLVSGSGLETLLINLLMIAVIPAIGEEFFFRGVVQKMILGKLKNHHYAVWIAAIIFSAFHLQFYGFFPRLFLGIIMGYLFVYSGTIWLPILAHFINNAIATVYYYLFNNGFVSHTTINEIGTGDTWSVGLASAILLLIIVLVTRKYKSQLRLNELI